MKKLSMLVIALMLTTGMFTVLGCGGGGGGSSEDVAYEGETMPSVIGTTDTAAMVELAKDAALAGEDAADFIPVPLSAGTVRMPSDPAEMIGYARGILSGAAGGGYDSVESLAVAEPLALECLPAEMFTDGSGGYYTEQLCGDEDTLRMTMTAVGYDDGSEYIDGTIIMEMNESPAEMTIIFRDYEYDDYVSDWFYADGIVTFRENSVTRFTLTYNLSMYDYNEDEGFWLNNYRVVIDEDSGLQEDTVTISGRFYDFDDGYVDISTVTTLVVPWNQDYPILGELQMTGAMGYWIKIRFDQDIPDVPILQVEVNVDEDPEWDWQSGWEYWVPLV